MNYKHLTILFLSLHFLSAQGQTSRSEGMIDLSTNLENSLVQQIPLKPLSTTGTYFYLDEWKKGQIELFNGSKINGFSLKYDIENDELVIKTDQAVKKLDGQDVRKFALTNSLQPINFINAKFYSINGIVKGGFYEILVVGENQLLSKQSVAIQQATYNPAIDMGTEENKIVKKETLFLARNMELFEFGSSQKKNLEIFGSKSQIIKQFAKDNKLKLKKKEDLIQIVSHYNSI